MLGPVMRICSGDCRSRPRGYDAGRAPQPHEGSTEGAATAGAPVSMRSREPLSPAGFRAPLIRFEVLSVCRGWLRFDVTGWLAEVGGEGREVVGEHEYGPRSHAGSAMPMPDPERAVPSGRQEVEPPEAVLDRSGAAYEAERTRLLCSQK